MLTYMSVVHVRFGKGPAQFFGDRGRVSVNTAFGLYRSGSHFLGHSKLIPPRSWDQIENKELTRSEDGAKVGKREYKVNGKLHREDGPAVIIGRIPNKQSQNMSSVNAKYPSVDSLQLATRTWFLHDRRIRSTTFDVSGGFADTIYTYGPRNRRRTKAAMKSVADGKVRYSKKEKKNGKKKYEVVEIGQREYDNIIKSLWSYYAEQDISFPTSDRIIEASKKRFIEFS